MVPHQVCHQLASSMASESREPFRSRRVGKSSMFYIAWVCYVDILTSTPFSSEIVCSRVYRCEEAAQRGIAYCGKSAIASTSAAGAGQEVSVHQTESLEAVNMPPTNCNPRDPVLPADCDRKPPAEPNQPSKSTTHSATPEELKQTTNQNSSLESFGSSDLLNGAPPKPEEYHTFRSMPVDSEGESHSSEPNNSSTDSDGSPSAGYRELPVQHEHDKQQLDSLTVPDEPERDTIDISSPETWTQLGQAPLESSSSLCTEKEGDTEHPTALAREGCVSPSHSSGSAGSFYSEEEEEEEEEEYMPKVGKMVVDICSLLLPQSAGSDVTDLSPDGAGCKCVVCVT